MVKIEVANGYYLFKLDDVLKQRNISINKLMRDTNTDFKVIKRIMKGDVVKIDIFVLDRFCSYLKCDVDELIEYEPKDNDIPYSM